MNTKITITMRNKGRLLANANVSLKTVDYGFVTIKGFQIWTSGNVNERLGENINITPPTRQAYGKYIHQVFFEDKTLWPTVEGEIYSAFVEAKEKESSAPQEEERVNIDEADKAISG